MANFGYKKVENTTMKLKGVLDVDTMTIDIDEEMKYLRTLLSDFNGAFVDMTIKVQVDEELDEPVEYVSEDAYVD